MHTESHLIRPVLAGLPVAEAIHTPPGTVAIMHADVVNAGLDPDAVLRWLQPLGGHDGVAYMRPARERLSNDAVRSALHPISYFVVPLTALQPTAVA